LDDWKELIEWQPEYQWSDAEREIHMRICDMQDHARSNGHSVPTDDDEELNEAVGRFEEFEGPEGKTRVPLNASAWQLYSTMAGADEAATYLAEELKKAIKAPSRGEAIDIVNKALSKYSSFGATDTEPRCVAEGCLSDARGGDYAWAL
jgi:hypothetical protein